MSSFAKQTILVTGATSGIGAAVSRELSLAGASLLLLGRDERKLKELESSLPNTSHKRIVADIQEEDTLEAAAEKVANLQPDIVIHALGGTLGFRSQTPSRDQWQSVFNANFHAIVSLDQAIIPAMEQRKDGRIIHLCSSSSVNCRGSLAYGAAKAALAHYTRSLGKRLARSNVIIFGYSPGIVESPSNWAKAKTENSAAYENACQSQPLGRLQSPQEIAKNLAFFCRPEANIYAGSIINADGSL